MTAKTPPITTKSIERFRSQHLHNQRAVNVFLPPDYDSHPERSYKVLYVNDGQDMSAVRMAETLAALLAHHESERNSIDEYTA